MDPWLALFIGFLIGFSLAGWLAQQNPKLFAKGKGGNQPKDWFSDL